MAMFQVRRRRVVLSDSAKQSVITRQSVSGKTVTDFCRDERIAVSSFYCWKKTLSGKRLSVERPADKPLPFVEIPLTVAAPKAVPVRVVFANGDRVETASDCDPASLTAILRALRAASC